MSGQTKTLIAIALFVAFCVGSFVWFLVNWSGDHSTKAAAPILSLTEAA